MGDSIVDNGSNTTNGLRNNRGLLLNAMRKLGQPFKVLAQAGYPGWRTDEILTRWSKVVTKHNPGLVLWESGINDFNAGFSSLAAFEQIKIVHARAISEGRRFVYLGMPPLYYNSLAAEFFQRIRQFSHENSTFEYTGGSERLIDYNGTPTQLGVPTFKTNALMAGGHPSAYGVNLWGDAIADYFRRAGYKAGSPFCAAGNSGVAQSSEFLNNMIVNGLVGASGTGWSANVSPAGTRTPTTSVVAMGTTGLQPMVPGRLYQTVWAPGTNPTDQDVMGTAVVTDNNGDAAQFAGRRFVARCYAKVTSTGGAVHDIRLNAVGYDWSYGATLFSESDNAAFDMGSLPTWSMNTTSHEGVFETEPFTMPATWSSPTQAHIIGYLNVSAEVGATVTTQVGAMEIVEVFSL